MISTLVVCALIATASSATNCSSSAVKPFTYNYGSINVFLNIATGISRGLIRKPSEEFLREIVDVANQDDPDYQSLVSSAIHENVGSIVFASMSIVFAAACLLCLVVVCITRMVCGSCGADGYYKSKRSKISLFVSLGLIGVCIVFLIIGLAIYWQSIDHTYHFANDEVWDDVETFLNDSKNFMDNTKCELSLVVNENTQNIINGASHLLNSEPMSIFNSFLDVTGISQMDLSTIDDELYKKVIPSLKKCESSLQKLGSLDDKDGEIEDEKSTVQTQLIAVKTARTSMGHLLNETSKIYEDVNRNVGQAQKQMISSEKDAEKQLNKIQESVSQTTDGISNQTDNINSIIVNINDQIQQHRAELKDNNVLNAIRRGAIALGVIPLALAILFMGIALCCGLASFFFSSPQYAHKRGVLNIGGCAAMVGVYLIFALGVVMFLLTLIAYAGGFATSAICKPVFKDEKYMLFNVSDIFVFKITTIDGKVNKIYLLEFLQKCSKETLFNAMGGYNLISYDEIMKKANIDAQKTEMNKTIAKLDVNFTIPQTYIQEFKNASDLLKRTTSSFRNQIEFLPKTSHHYPGNPDVEEAVKDLKEASSEMQVFVHVLQNYNDAVDKAYNISERGQIKTPIITGFVKLFDDIDKDVTSGVRNMLSNLIEKVAPCAPLKQIFDNVGAMVCDGLGKPVNGAWAAIGMASLFLLPGAFLMIYLSGWMYNEKFIQYNHAINDAYDNSPLENEYYGIPRSIVSKSSNNHGHWDGAPAEDGHSSTTSRLRRF